MIKEILPSLYGLEIPLPKSPLRAVNSYLIKAERSLLIDTGLDLDECKREMLNDLKTLGVSRESIDFFITHVHADHLRLLPEIMTAQSTVYFNRQEAALSGFLTQWHRIGQYYVLNGFPEKEIGKAFAAHPGGSQVMPPLNYHILREGDLLEAGDYRFRCIETPGHSPGHICLYEADKKLLVSGDHLLLEITPNISLWDDGRNPLKEYLASLDKVYPLEVNLVLPGHGSLFSDHRKIIDELKNHHKERNEQILAILNRGAIDAYRISSLVSWDVEYESWELFPSMQKLFAVGETLSHLKYLEVEGQVHKVKKNGIYVFSVTRDKVC